MQTYEYPNQFFRDAFQQRSLSGISVHIIIEDQKYQQFSNPITQLQSDFSGYESIEVKSDQQMGTTYVHSKISLSDTAFRIQSANLTTSSFESNREHFFTSSHPEVLASLQQLFDNDWNGIPLQSADFHPNLVVCPTNCRAVIEALLSGARTSIIIQTQYITDQSILHILRQKSQQLAINIIVADTIDNAELTAYF
ncbi:MAG: phospholipase D-like domain-containing protein [Candidatus Peribacteria bacterium]|nr:phospholipase D-like domain-containing protein [Candidatus Peribacteria bacterium]